MEKVVDFLSYSLETGTQDASSLVDTVNDRLERLMASWDLLEATHGKCMLLADLESFIERAGWDA